SDAGPAADMERRRFELKSIWKSWCEYPYFRRIAMKKASLMAAIVPLVVVGSSTGAAELPMFEAMGLPISPHQVAVQGSAHVQEQSAVATLTLGDMPASPHQLAVLKPRSNILEASADSPKRATVGHRP